MHMGVNSDSAAPGAGVNSLVPALASQQQEALAQEVEKKRMSQAVSKFVGARRSP